jgi:hypothetical protein
LSRADTQHSIFKLEEMEPQGNGMRRLMTVLVILLAIAVLAHSKTFVQLGGNDGASLLNDLTNNSTNLSSVNSTTINLTHSATTMQLGVNNSMALLERLTNGSSSQRRSNTTGDDLSSWGSKPRAPPPPPTYDPKAAQLYEILRQNHLGY